MNPFPGAAHLQRPALVDGGRSLLAGLAGILPFRRPHAVRRGVRLSLTMPHKVMSKSS